MTEPVKQQPNWSQADMAFAAERWQALFADVYGEDGEDTDAPREMRHRIFERIGEGLKRTAFAVATRYKMFGATFGEGMGRGSAASSRALADRAARKEAEGSRTLTATFFGDPPPGYSALDQRRRTA